MGGVIDSDYRGEIKIMAFNTTNEDIFLNRQECIAQLIIEHIATPNVREVELLGSTDRGTSGFGSTTRNQVCSSHKANPACLGCHYCCSDEDYAEEYEVTCSKAEEYEATRSKAQKQKETISPLTIKPFPEEQLLAMQKKAKTIQKCIPFAKTSIKVAVSVILLHLVKWSCSANNEVFD
ncbi:hypothetical protein ZIOFF_042312 [Zingiber officinale]|uniref:Deoxyuridine 5'-triphosphate nucleotidohydrolase n=1 Tax=Zingiber officinale TaxID=94328 RepID=A0A8J5KZV3_ZINOF|nr:hypothetical protein ZIOFF_042312 [Zingiber officinale]